MNRPEEVLQRSVADYLNAVIPNCIWFHCPNGGRRSKAEAGILKAMGAKAGIPDLVFVLADGRAAFIELKSDTGRLNGDQARFKADCEFRGIPYAVCRSLPEVQGTLDGWRVHTRGRIAA